MACRVGHGTRGIAQWLRALGALPEEPGSVPSTHTVLPFVTPVLGDPMPLLVGTRHVLSVQIYMQENTYIHKKL